MLDLDRSPGEAERLGVSDYNVVVLEVGGRRERVDIVNEEALTAALLGRRGTPARDRLLRAGHGEPTHATPTSARGWGEAAAALATRRLRRAPAAGARRAFPTTRGLVVLAGRTRELQPAESATRSTPGCGAAADCVVLADPDAPRSLAALLARFGIELDGDLVVDERVGSVRRRRPRRRASPT